MDRTDAALVEQCLAGRTESFSELVRRHQDRVFQFALRMTLDRDDAADLAQETFVRAFRKLRMYDAQYAFGSWLLSICANLGKNRFRSEDRRRRAHQAHLELFARTEEPDKRRAAMKEALALIPPEMRMPLVLRHVEGLSYEEVAQVLGIGVSAAKMRVKRARDRLIELLAPARGGGVS